MTSEALKERVGETLRFRVEGSAGAREGKVERLSADERWVVISGIGFLVEQIAEVPPGRGHEGEALEVAANEGGENV